jgi:hypothetical protein
VAGKDREHVFPVGRICDFPAERTLRSADLPLEAGKDGGEIHGTETAALGRGQEKRRVFGKSFPEKDAG